MIGADAVDDDITAGRYHQIGLKRMKLIPHHAFCGVESEETTEKHHDTEDITAIPVSTVEAAKYAVEEYKEKGCIAAEAGNFVAAINSWHRGLMLDPDNGVLFELKAQAFLALDDPIRACFEAERCVALKPSWPLGHHTLARARREAGELALSLQSYQQAHHLVQGDETCCLDSDTLNLLEEEMLDVSKLLDQLHEHRRVYENALLGIHEEAKQCLLNLSNRAMNFTDPTLHAHVVDQTTQYHHQQGVRTEEQEQEDA